MEDNSLHAVSMYSPMLFNINVSYIHSSTVQHREHRDQGMRQVVA